MKEASIQINPNKNIPDPMIWIIPMSIISLRKNRSNDTKVKRTG
jgi:hypothetical protein